MYYVQVPSLLQIDILYQNNRYGGSDSEALTLRGLGKDLNFFVLPFIKYVYVS